MAELEAQLGHPVAQTGREELSQSVEELKALLKAKDQVRQLYRSIHVEVTWLTEPLKIFCSEMGGKPFVTLS